MDDDDDDEHETFSDVTTIDARSVSNVRMCKLKLVPYRYGRHTPSVRVSNVQVIARVRPGGTEESSSSDYCA